MAGSTLNYFSVLVLTVCVLYSSSAPIVTIESDNEVVPAVSASSMEDDREHETFSDHLASMLKPMYNKFLILYYREIMSTMIWIEFYTIATGDHFGMLNSNVNASVDQELHVTAMAIADLWLKLPTLEKTQIAIAEVTIEVAELVGHAIVNNEPIAITADEVIPTVLRKIEVKLQNDESLYRKYVTVKSRIADEQMNGTSTHRTYFTGTHMTRRREKLVFNEWYSHPRIRNFIFHKLFVQHYLMPVPLTASEEHEHVVTAKAIVQLSKIENRTEEVNKIYNKTIFEVATHFEPRKYPLRKETPALGGLNPVMFANQTVPRLFDKLEKNFRENSMLYLELVAVKKTVEHLAIIDNWAAIISNGPF